MLLLQTNGLFPNYFRSNATQFSDASSTALLSAAYYRLAHLALTNPNISSLPALATVETSRSAVYSSVSKQTGNLSPVVNPLKYGSQGTTSPEGQAFVLLMEAAWRDWYEAVNGAGSASETGSRASAGERVRGVGWVAAAAAVALCFRVWDI